MDSTWSTPWTDMYSVRYYEAFFIKFHCKKTSTQKQTVCSLVPADKLPLVVAAASSAFATRDSWMAHPPPFASTIFSYKISRFTDTHSGQRGWRGGAHCMFAFNLWYNNEISQTAWKKAILLLWNCSNETKKLP